VLNYHPDLEAYRTDRFMGYVDSPAVETGWLLWGFNNDSFMNLVPVSEAAVATRADSKGVPTWVWLAVAAPAAVIVGGVLISRPRGEDVE